MATNGGKAPLPRPPPVFPGDSSASASSSSPAVAASATSCSGEGSNQMEALLTRYYFNQELDRAQAQMKKEEHNKRMKSLRTKELEHLNATQWQFHPVDKLISQ